jgi:creatinine amidohydrolase
MKQFTPAVLLFTVAAWAVFPSQAQQGTPKGRGPARKDMSALVNPIEAHDTVFIEAMTQIEIRDALKAGKTTALLFVGGMEDNGPYITVSQHNDIVRGMCDMIARELGNALCTPILGMAPGNPDTSSNPGSVVLPPETFKGVLSGIATSLKTQGFKNIMLMVDHGSDQGPTVEVSRALAEAWKGSGAMAYYVKEYYNYNEVEKFEHDVLKVEEKREGYHDDYYTASISVALDPVSARMPERIKAKKTTINGVELAGPKAIEDGKKIMRFRADATVKAIKALLK